MKRNINILWGVLLVMIAFSSCRSDETFPSTVVGGAKPVVEFTHQINFLEVTFENASIDAESYYWEFGDGVTSTEQSPKHQYAATGYYKVKLTARSDAGYSDTFESEPIYVVGMAVPDFSAKNGYHMEVALDASKSQNLKAARWEFGDGKTGEGVTVTHSYESAGSYLVKLIVTGLRDETVEITKEITVAWNGLRGSDMETSAAQYWSVMPNGDGINPVTIGFGYTEDVPDGGEGGCFRFCSFDDKDHWSGLITVIYQPVEVVLGEQYRLSARVKTPAGGNNFFFQFYIADELNFVEGVNSFLCLNTWHAWGTEASGSTAENGDLLSIVKANGEYGAGVATDGVYTATRTGTVYIGIQCGTYSGKSNGDVLMDNVRFERVN